MSMLTNNTLNTTEYTLPQDMIEFSLVLLDDENFDDAISNIMAYVTPDCLRLGIRRIRFVSTESGDITTRDVAVSGHSAA